jgi:chromosome segregation ATPase
MKTEQEETMISHQNEVKKLQEQLVVARNEASSEFERTITDIQAKHSEKLSALMAEHREAMDELREEVNSKDGDVNKTVTALGEEKVSRRLSQFKHAANVAKTNKYKKQIEELQEELGEARAQAVRLHDQIKQEKKHSLDMKKDYESQLKQNAHQLREKFNAHTASLSEEHAAVLNDLSKSHINELGAVKKCSIDRKN